MLPNPTNIQLQQRRGCQGTLWWGLRFHGAISDGQGLLCSRRLEFVEVSCLHRIHRRILVCSFAVRTSRTSSNSLGKPRLWQALRSELQVGGARLSGERGSGSRNSRQFCRACVWLDSATRACPNGHKQGVDLKVVGQFAGCLLDSMH